MLFEEDFLMDYECIQSGKYTVSFRSKERKLEPKQVPFDEALIN